MGGDSEKVSRQEVGLKLKYNFKNYVHTVENMPKSCTDKHKN